MDHTIFSMSIVSNTPDATAIIKGGNAYQIGRAHV